MKSKIIIAIFAIAICVMGYIAIQNMDHDDHKRNYKQNVYPQDETESLDVHDNEGQAVELTAEEIKEIALETAFAGPGNIDKHIILTGQIKINQDQMVHIVPRVEGVVTKVNKKLGDKVVADEVIAVIESKELAEAKAAYLGSTERYEMARLDFEREQKLWIEKISSEQEYLNKKQALTEAGIAKRTAEQKLYALGFYESYLKKFLNSSEQSLIRFEIKAPFEGTVTGKHIVLGELVGTGSTVYVIADFNSVWIDLQVYPKDLKYIEEGQKVTISADSEIPDASGTISYVGPIVETESRTALARVVLSNESGIFRPGLFVTAKTTISKKQAKVVVPKDAIQSLEGRKCVFIKDDHGFEPAFVEIGLVDTNYAEIISGLSAEQEYVTKGAFALKAKIATSTLDSHAGHGH